MVRAADDAVVSHPALKSMPFESSIEGWARSYFPGAAYTARDQDRVAAQDLDLMTPGVLVVQAPKGAGKSKAIREAAHSQLPAKASVLQITFRRSLAWSSCALSGSGASLYSALPEGAISARQHPRLTIVINSISRVRGSYDVVIIDEIVSVLDMLAGSLLNDTARVSAVSTLAALVGAARTVVIADAMLDASCVDFVLLCRQMAQAACCPARYWADPLASLRFLDYTRRLHGAYQFVPHAKLATWTAALDAAVAAGQRVVVPCMTKTQAEAVAARYRSEHAVRLYTADTDAALLQAHMSDIHTAWSQASVLVYSPVVTAGCSFELPHFDTVFFYGCARLGSVRSAIQMIARVRDVRTQTVHVFLSKAESYEPLDAAVLRRPPTYASVSDYPDGYMKLLELLAHHRRLETLCAATSFPYYFWSLVVHSGARIRFVASGRAPAGEALPAVVAPAHAAQEQWWQHNWEADLAPCEYDIGVATAVTGTLLERVTKVQPDHLRDVGAVATGATSTTPPASVPPILPGWMAAAPETAKVWARLMARRVAALPGATTTRAQTHKRVAASGDTPHVILYPPIMRFTAPPEQVNALYQHASRYMDPDRSWMDVTTDAWAMALAETRASHVPAGSACIAESLEIASRVGDALSRFRARVLHVGVCVGNQAATPHRFVPNAAIADFMVEAVDGKLHLVMCRVEGSPDLHATTDVMKMQAMAAASDVPVATITMLYLGCNAVVHAPTWPSPVMDGLVSTSPAYVRPWHPCAHVEFVYVPPTAHASPSVAVDDRAERRVSWGAGGSGDIQAVVRARLHIPEDVRLDIFQANVVDTYPCALTGIQPLDHLRSLYMGICKKRYFVYFWNGKPHGIPVWSL